MKSKEVLRILNVTRQTLTQYVKNEKIRVVDGERKKLDLIKQDLQNEIE